MLDIQLTAEVLDYSCTNAVSDHGHLKSTFLLLTVLQWNLS